MSEPLTSHEIEDVLSSIRRLVSEDLRPGGRAAAGAAPAAPISPTVPVAPQPDAGKLLLTPSLRVVAGEAAPEPEPVLEAAAPAPVGTDAPPAPADEVYDDQGLDEGDSGLKALLDTVAPAEARVESDPVSPWDATEDEVLWSAPGTTDDTMTEDLVEAPAADPPREAAGSWTLQDVPAVDWAQEETDWVEPDPVAFVAHPRKASLADDPLARAWADRAEAEVHAELHGAAPVQPPKPEATEPPRSKAASAPTPEPGLFDGAETEIDEETLRDIVREIIREELAGSLGERITRNVRKLVRIEINRALTAREFDLLARAAGRTRNEKARPGARLLHFGRRSPDQAASPISASSAWRRSDSSRLRATLVRTPFETNSIRPLTTRSFGSMPAQDSTSRPSRDRAQRAIWSGPLPYFLSSAMASSRAARTTAANSLRARWPCSKLNAVLSIESSITKSLVVILSFPACCACNDLITIRGLPVCNNTIASGAWLKTEATKSCGRNRA